jgi:uncharacterized membrane protein YfcA
MVMLLAGAVGIGAALGLLGGGGTVLTVPLLHAVLGVDTAHAVAMSLPVVAVAAGAGAVMAWRRGALAVAPTLVLAAATSSGAFLGALAGRQLSAATQGRLLAATLVAAAVALWQPLVRPGGTPRPTPWLLAAAGVGVGVVTGLVGVGGGFLIVPALVTLGGYPLDRAVPASLFVIALSASAGALGYAGHVDVPWATVAIIAAAAVLGVVAGGRVGARIPAAPLQRAFALFLLVNAANMLAVH